MNAAFSALPLAVSSRSILPRSLRALTLASTVGLAACGASSSGGGAGGAPTATAAVAHSVAFDDSSTLELSVGDVVTLSVSVLDAHGAPVPDATVRFALLGEHADASLETSTQTTDASGRASARLHSSSSTTTFVVRAAVDGAPSSERGVGVSGMGFAKLLVLPAYTGKRAVATWTASATVAGTCGDTKGPRPDGPLVASAPAGSPLVVAGVPVGSRVMVTLRSAHAIGGCLDLDDLTSGADARTVTVPVANVPVVIRPGTFSLKLDVTPDAAPWTKVLEAWRARFVAAFLGGAETVSAGLLDTMASSLPTGQSAAFQAARLAGGWDGAVTAALGGTGPDLLVSTWVPAAIVAAKAGPASLTATVVATQSDSTFTPGSLFGVDLTGAPPPKKAFAWSSTVDDQISVTGAVDVAPSRVLASVVAVQALAGGAPSMAEALGSTSVCPALGAALGGLASCKGTCLRDLCASALGTMWERARSADDATSTSATVAFAAGASDPQVDDDARLVSFSGTWVGTISDSGVPALSAPAKGAATAARTSAGGQ
jgi:hypothetical protein